jgi:hypothetical protein
MNKLTFFEALGGRIIAPVGVARFFFRTWWTSFRLSCRMQRQQMRTGHENRIQGAFWQHFWDTNQQMMAEAVRTNTMVIKLEKLPARITRLKKLIYVLKNKFLSIVSNYTVDRNFFKPVPAPIQFYLPNLILIFSIVKKHKIY